MRISTLFLFLITVFFSCDDEDNNRIAQLKNQVTRLERELSNGQEQLPIKENSTDEVKSKCNIDNAVFQKKGDENNRFIRFYNKSGDKIEFTGEFDGESLSGTAVLHGYKGGYKISAIKGGFSGEILLFSDCRQLTGSLKEKEFGTMYSIDFVKK